MQSGSFSQHEPNLFSHIYFNFTKSNTKIDHTPTVSGNCTSCSSRNGPPLGIAKESANIAKAVRIPRTNFVLKFMVSQFLSSCSIRYAGRQPAASEGISSSQNGLSATDSCKGLPTSDDRPENDRGQPCGFGRAREPRRRGKRRSNV